jgi:aromatic aminotransferase
MVLQALQPLGNDAVAAGEAAIYFFAKLPEGMDDEAVVQRLVKEHGVTTIPGSACGCPGFIRVAYANCTASQCTHVCERLKRGLETLVEEHSRVK